MTAGTHAHFFRHITFDLDDTLLDTSGALIPAAARRAVEAMITASQGRLGDVQLWLSKRIEILRADPRADVWLQLARGDDEIADVGRRAFFTHPIESLPHEAMRVTPGAFEILDWAQENSTLHLVTSGDRKTQEKKIERLGIARYFESIHFVDPKHAYGRTKNDAFKEIQSRFPGLSPIEFLSIGNRVDMDLGEAKILGWKTAWIRYGEHASLTPQKNEEIPDYEVASLSDLLSIWRQQFSDLTTSRQASAWKK